MSGSGSSTALTQGEQLKGMISSLQEMLESKLPGYKEVLQRIHIQLRKDENLVHLLTEQEIGTVVAGLAQHTGVVISGAASKAAGKKAAGKITVKDL